MIKQQWEELSAGKKRIIAVVGGVSILVLMVSIFSGESERKPRQTTEDTIRNVLTDANTRDIGLDSLSAQLEIESQEKQELQKRLDRVEREMARTKEEMRGQDDVGRDINRLQQDLEFVTSKLKEIEKSGARKAEESVDSEQESAPTTSKRNSENVSASNEADVSDSDEFFRNAPVPSGADTTGRRGEAGSEGRSQSFGMSVSRGPSQAKDEKVESDDIEEEAVYLPAGSILTGVLINGMDAPTAQGARRDPFPSTLRIQKEAILPNRYRADVRECFVIVSGYGDLSSERAYLRGETISCIREDGGAIEARLSSYVVGEDGKAGVRGRLVSKQGQIIAKSLMAGFLSGASKAFDVNPVPTINTNGTGQQQYQSVMSDQMLQGAAVKGASDALDRIAKFYVEMAEGLFPVIEVDAGRQIDIIISSGTSLKVK